MQKVFAHCGALDNRCYETYHLNEDILMEHAAIGMHNFITNKFKPPMSVLIVCGTGNNGADGMALARLLHPQYQVKLYLPFGVKSDMAKLQLKRVSSIGIKLIDEIEDATIVVDCLLGSGAKGELKIQYKQVISQLNALNGYKIACDIPSGISSSGNSLGEIFRADTTITMGGYKEALFLDETKDFIGKIIKVNLGVDGKFYETNTDTYLLEKHDLKLPLRHATSSHKGTFGHAVIFCGEKEGAGIISAEAAYRFGAGLTTLVVQEKISIPPHLMHAYKLPDNATAIGIGMGLGGHFEEVFLDKYIGSNTIALVIDADALYSPKLLKLFMKTKKTIVMTPHPKEFIYMWRILSGEEITLETLQSKRFEYARKFSSLFPDIILLLKGANMIIAFDNKLYINPIGSQNLSKGGSGDVLSGLIVALLAQGYSGLDAAISSSLALSLASRRFKGANYAMSSLDIISQIGKLHKEF
mgnify:CR=1 FL=1